MYISNFIECLVRFLSKQLSIYSSNVEILSVLPYYCLKRVAGAVLTNPLDVIRNEMFKTNFSMLDTIKHLRNEMGWTFLHRGMVKNLVAVSIPVASTIFFTDIFIDLTKR
mmetsp:Transcript_36872/g.44445  ORF Transcript_36872/g.44445 Transcript_36872/m.44445 type:complete len:110 (-) Transcript_36872:198-527(-)